LLVSVRISYPRLRFRIQAGLRSERKDLGDSILQLASCISVSISIAPELAGILHSSCFFFDDSIVKLFRGGLGLLS
jgi:hypothetical protein